MCNCLIFEINLVIFRGLGMGLTLSVEVLETRLKTELARCNLIPLALSLNPKVQRQG